MLRKIRIVLAAVAFAAITLLFLDFTGSIHAWFGWLAKVQFLPALLALNVGVVVALIVLTLLCGRIYCSVICPLGVMQDIVAWCGRRGAKKNRYRYTYSPAKRWLRYGMLALFVITLVAGIASVADLFAPYSAYGRIAQNLFAPLYAWGNNALAYLAERVDSYAFYPKEVWVRSWVTFGVAVATFVIVCTLAWRNGRTYCNTVCPVGTVLGFFARFSLLRPVIDTAKCRNCSLCARGCKASCIDYKNHRIDYSRCVACMDCIDNCKHDALHYRLRPLKGETAPDTAAAPATQTPTAPATTTAHAPKTAAETAPTDPSRRSFLAGLGILAGTAAAKAQEKKVDGGLAVILDKKVPHRATPIVPPGAQGIRHFAAHCTGCQLCVAVCPNNVLRPSTRLEGLMQPESSYERGYCRPECTKCSEVCPAGAILKITPAEKSSIQVGHAVWVRHNCVVLTDGVTCGNCARHCPAGAITMVPSDASAPASPRIPVVNDERCIGCGACENLCPARPFSAIYVEGHEQHKTI